MKHDDLPFSEYWAAVQRLSREFKWAEVRAALDECAALASSAALAPASRARFGAEMRAWRFRSAPWWWDPVAGGGVVLRRTDADDADFYRACYADAEFSRRFNRQTPWKGDLRVALRRAGHDSPAAMGGIMWIATSRTGEPFGLVSLSSIDRLNAKAQLSIGFPNLSAPIHGLKAMLLAMHFCFFTVRLNKLFAYVYEDNKEALDQALGVGFHLEGTFRDHTYLPGFGFVTVHATGLTRSQLQQDARLCGKAKRWLGIEWTAQIPQTVSGAAPR